MPAKMPDNIRTALESELAGLEARIAAVGDDPAWAEQAAGWAERVKLVKAELGTKRTTKRAAEKRPAEGTEKRPG